MIAAMMFQILYAKKTQWSALFCPSFPWVEISFTLTIAYTVTHRGASSMYPPHLLPVHFIQKNYRPRNSSAHKACLYGLLKIREPVKP